MANSRHFSRRSVLTGIAGSSLIFGDVGTVAANDGPSSSDHWLYVVLAGEAGLTGRLERAGFDVVHELAGESVYIVEGPENRIDDLRSIAAVGDIVPNERYIFGGPEHGAGQERDLVEPSPEHQWDKGIVGATEAHERATGEGTTLAVIDSGVSHSHPDVAPQLDTERSRLFRDGRIHSGTDDVNVADEVPYAVDKVPESIGQFSKGLVRTKTVDQPVADDVDGHGTHVAGIAAASDDSDGFVGMAPDTTIVPLRPLFYARLANVERKEQRLLTSSAVDILLAIDHAVEIGVDVINLSTQSVHFDDSRAFAAYRRVIQYAIEQGIVVVAAAGNDRVDLDQYPGYILPGDSPGSITVGATGPTNKRSSYSNYGDGTVDVAAPGGGYETEAKTLRDTDVEYPYPTNFVLSTVPEDIYGRQYEYFPGTSMAAPQVAGLACLLRELAPEAHPRRIRQAITESAVELTGEDTSGLGAGRIDAPAAIDRITEHF